MSSFFDYTPVLFNLFACVSTRATFFSRFRRVASADTSTSYVYPSLRGRDCRHGTAGPDHGFVSSPLVLSFFIHDLPRCVTILHRPSGIDERQLSGLANDDWRYHCHSDVPRTVDVWYPRHREAGAKGVIADHVENTCLSSTAHPAHVALRAPLLAPHTRRSCYMYL